MRELSLNVMDVAQNSVRAQASLVRITVIESDREDRLTIEISDNGCGMTDEQVQQVIDPFFTTRTTRKVGLGVPLFKLSAEQTGGSFDIKSKVGEGTVTTANYVKSSVDMTLDTRELREVLEGVSLDTPDVLEWIAQYLEENSQNIYGGAEK